MMYLMRIKWRAGERVQNPENNRYALPCNSICFHIKYISSDHPDVTLIHSNNRTYPPIFNQENPHIYSYNPFKFALKEINFNWTVICTSLKI